MIHKAGAGPEPIPQKELKASTLADAIKYCLTEKAKSAAEFIAGQIKAEVRIQLSGGSHQPLKNNLDVMFLRMDRKAE